MQSFRRPILRKFAWYFAFIRKRYVFAGSALRISVATRKRTRDAGTVKKRPKRQNVGKNGKRRQNGATGPQSRQDGITAQKTARRQNGASVEFNNDERRGILFSVSRGIQPVFRPGCHGTQNRKGSRHLRGSFRQKGSNRLQAYRRRQGCLTDQLPPSAFSALPSSFAAVAFFMGSVG